MSDWSVDDDGGLRTPSGMLIGRFTPSGDLEILDRKEHRTVALSLLTWIVLFLRWRARQ